MDKINRIAPLDHSYLQILECLADTPKTVYYRGVLPTERRPTVAIVGTRKPTSYGREVTMKLAGDLARQGVVIVSGLALGVDAIAHQAALDAGGTTIAVQANGLHRIYPATNNKLADLILQNSGAILSEHDVGVEPMQYRFLERNRIVSGLADAIIITEAAARSGTLNTAAHALNQGKDLYVVPGNITSPLSAGCNLLLRQGAMPILEANDILSVLLPVNSVNNQKALPIGSTELENQIIKAISSGVRDGDEIIAQLQTTPAEFNTALTMLEINGVIKPLGGNRWTLD